MAAEVGSSRVSWEDQASKLSGGHTMRDFKFNGKVRSFGGSFKSLSRRVPQGAPGWDAVSLSHDLGIGDVAQPGTGTESLGHLPELTAYGIQFSEPSGQSALSLDAALPCSGL